MKNIRCCFPLLFTLLFFLLHASVLKAQEVPSVALEQLKLTCANGEMENGQTAVIVARLNGITNPSQVDSVKWWEKKADEWVKLLPKYYSGDSLVARGLKANVDYKFLLYLADTLQPVVGDSIRTRSFPVPDIVIHCEPGDSVYIQNPDVTFSFENLSEDSVTVDHFFWTFEEGITSTLEKPVFTYVEVKYTSEHYEPTLTVYDDCGCETVFPKAVYVLPVKLKIPNVFTPNGDDVNDVFEITLDDGSGSDGSGSVKSRAGGVNGKLLSDYYQSNELIIMNRWGRIVYHQKNYQNDWDGGGLSDGTYYYVLKCKGLKEEVQYQGVVMILSN